MSVVCCACVLSVCVWCMCGAAWHAENPRVYAQNVSVCRFKTHPCIPAKRAHVEHTRAFCRHTRMRFEPTHGDVLSIHTEKREGGRGGGGGGGVVVVQMIKDTACLSRLVPACS